MHYPLMSLDITSCRRLDLMRGVIVKGVLLAALGSVLLVEAGCARSPADESVDKQLKLARESGVYVTPEQERQMREAAHQSYGRERELQK